MRLKLKRVRDPRLAELDSPNGYSSCPITDTEILILVARFTAQFDVFIFDTEKPFSVNKVHRIELKGFYPDNMSIHQVGDGRAIVWDTEEHLGWIEMTYDGVGLDFNRPEN